MPQWSSPWNPGSKAPGQVPVVLGPQATWVRVTPQGGATFTTFAAAALTNSVALFFLPPSAIIHGIKISPTASFTGGSIATYTVSVGDGATPALYASAFDVHQAPGADVYQLSSNFGGESMVAATQIYATATSTVANLNAATAGAVDIFAYLSIAK